MQITWSEKDVTLPYSSLTLITARVGDHLYHIGAMAINDGKVDCDEKEKAKITLTSYIHQHFNNDDALFKQCTEYGMTKEEAMRHVQANRKEAKI